VPESGTFSDLWYSTFKCSKLARKVNWLLLARRCLQVPGRKRLIHFACRFGALKRNVEDLKKCQNYEIFRTLDLDLQYSPSKCSALACKGSNFFWLGPVRICVLCTVLCTYVLLGRKRLIHFACQLGALKSEILRIGKMCHIPEILRNLALLLDLQYSTFKCPTSMQSVSASAGRELCRSVKCLDRKGWFTLHANFEYIEVGFWRSEKKCQNPDILRNLAPVLDLLNFPCKGSDWTCNVPPLFPQ
jgi:hypothetical protein